MKRLFTPISCAVALLIYSCLTSFADKAVQDSTGPSPSSNGPPERPYYLTGDEEVWKTFPAKPALGSAIDQADLLITLSMQNSRNEDQKNEALRDRKYSIKLVTDVIDTDFETKYPNVFKVLGNADIDSYFINTLIKKTNARLRPFVQHPTLVTPLLMWATSVIPAGMRPGPSSRRGSWQSCFPSKKTRY
jgi:hypothetical protein